MMGKLGILVLVVASLVAGCAAPVKHYGNFVAEPAPGSLSQTLAADTVKQLMALYPPASTRFDFKQSTPDAYGAALVESLRTNGYALLEFKPEDATQDAKPEPSAMESVGLSFNYILDAPATTNLYRVLVIVGPRTLSRAYLVQNNTIAPAGAWARKE